MKTRHIRYSGAARWAVLSLLTLMGSSMGFAQEELVDVTEQVGVTSVAGEAAAWTFTMPGYSVKADVEYYASPVASVTKNAGTAEASTQTYDTFVDALIAANDGDVLTLCKDIDIAPTEGPFESGLLVIAVGTGDDPLTLDLNGHTLAFPEGGFLTVSSDGALVVTDSSEGGNGKLTSATGFAVWVCYGGHLTIEGGCVETTNTTGEAPYKSAIYNQGEMMTNGGTVSGTVFGIYNDGVLHLGAGKIAASQGFGVAGSDGQMDMLQFPEFDCMSDDIALNDDQLIYYGGKIYGKPKKKIKIYLENKEQKYFTYGYGIYMMTAPDGGTTEPSDVFYVSGISDARIGFCSRTSNYYEGNYLEAGIADETEITFPAGNSTYCDERALALSEWTDQLKFYAVTDVDTENKNVILTEVKSKRFGGNASLIVSNTSGAPITVKMVEAACSMMANSYQASFNKDVSIDDNPDEVQIYSYFEGTNEAIDQIDKLDGFTCYDLNGEEFVPMSNLGPVEAHRCWLMVNGLSSSDGNLTVVWPGTLTGVSVQGFSGIFDAKSHTVTATIPDGATIAYGTTEGQYDLTTAPTFTAIGTHTVYYKVSKEDYNDVTGSVIIEIKSVVNENGGVTLGGKTYLSLSDLALTYITNPAYKQMVVGLVAGITASDIDNFINRLVLDDNLNLVIKKGPNVIIGILQANAGQILKITGNGQMTIDQDMLYKLITEGKVRALSRAAGDDMEVESGVEYLVLQDCDLLITVNTEDADVTISDMSLRLPGDANDDKKVNAKDIVEMVNEMDPNKQPSEKFNLQNADMNDDQTITLEDINEVVKIIVNNKE